MHKDSDAQTARQDRAMQFFIESDGAEEVWSRLITVTGWLEKAGIPQDTIMLGYFNEAMRIAKNAGGVGQAWIMASQLQLHIGRAVKKLREAEAALRLDELPPISTQPPETDA